MIRTFWRGWPCVHCFNFALNISAIRSNAGFEMRWEVSCDHDLRAIIASGRSAVRRTCNQNREIKWAIMQSTALGEQSSFVRRGVKRIFISRHPGNEPHDLPIFWVIFLWDLDIWNWSSIPTRGKRGQRGQVTEEELWEVAEWWRDKKLKRY